MRVRPTGIARSNDAGRVRAFVLVLLVVVLALVLLILWRFLTPIILGILLGLLAAPVNAWLRDRVHVHRNITATLVVVGVFLIVVVPVSAFLFLLFTQGASLLSDLSVQIEEGVDSRILQVPLLERLQELIDRTLPEANLDSLSLRDQLAGLTDAAVQYLVQNGVEVFGNIADVIAKFFILLFLLFYLVRDGERMIERLRGLLPLREAQTSRIFAKIRDVTRAVVFGTFAVAVLQGVLGGVGFVIVGLPGLLWGTVIGVSSLVPVVGTALVTVPAIVYLFLNGLYWQTAFFAAWAVVLVGGVDNYLRPFLMRGQARMSPFCIFLAIVGGVATFGLSGLVFGPLIVAIAIVVVEIYREEYRPDAIARPRGRTAVGGNGRPGWRVKRALRR
jgi:predicted PurR-regulated permease PerM